VTSQIDSWLTALGLEKYVTLFEKEEIDEDVLAELSDQDLEKIGLPMGARKKILKALQANQLSDSQARQENNQTANIIQPSEAEKRHLTIMFCDLVGSTEMSQHLDPEDLREVNRAYQDAVTGAVEQFGGYVARYMGDGVLAYFGYPQAYEDSAERSVRAGLVTVDTIATLDIDPDAKGRFNLAVRVGIATGPVVVGDLIGEGASQENAVVGETPNLAARLQGVANPNEVVVSSETESLVGESIRFEELDPQSLKGFSTPVKAWRVLGAGSAGGRFERSIPRGLGRFVGRQAELESLHEDLSRALQGERIISHVIGEPGIGKSRLVHEFLGKAGKHANILQGHCASHGKSIAFMPFIDLIRRELGTGGEITSIALARHLQERFNEWGIDGESHVPYLLNLIGIEVPALAEIDSGLVGYRTREALVSIVLACSRQKPVVLYINDCHWIDKSSEALLEALIHGEAKSRIIILCTFRPEYVPPWTDTVSVNKVWLNLLSLSETKALLADRFAGAQISEELSEELFDRSGGNPYFAEELVHHMQRFSSESTGNSNSQQPVSVPRTLEGLLLERVDRLSAQSRRLLQIASVMGRNFNDSLAADVSGTAPQREFIQELVNRGLVFQENIIQPYTYRFKHALLHDAVYSSLLKSDRIRIHKAIADGLATLYQGREPEIVEELARHYLEAKENDAAATWAALAGEKALGLFACETATSWFEQALEILTSETNSDHELLGRTLINQMEAHCWEMNFPSLIALAEQYLPQIKAVGDFQHISRTYTWLADAYINTGRFSEALTVADKALAMGEEINNLECTGYALSMRLWLHALTGGVGEIDFVQRECERLYGIAKELDDLYLEALAYYSRALDLVQRGYFSSAREWIDKSLAMGEQTDYSPALVWPLCLRAYVAIFEETAETAERDAREAMRLAQSKYDQFMARMTLASALISNDKTNEGLKMMEQINAERETRNLSQTAFMYWPDIVNASGLFSENHFRVGISHLEERCSHFLNLGNRRAAAIASLKLAIAYLGRNDDTVAAEAADYWLQQANSLGEESGMNEVIAQALIKRASFSKAISDKKRYISRARTIGKEINSSRIEQLANKAFDELDSLN
jgi:class 3 adenylate cyclase/tetratricopeptide (TPR) repeat protein